MSDIPVDILDIIPIKLNKELPTKEQYFHASFVGNYTIEEVLHKIERGVRSKDIEYDNLIILKNRKVICII